jgi:Cu(I)/Ag(I) efflux system membrane fusion protein
VKTTTAILGMAALVATALATGYWWGGQGSRHGAEATSKMAETAKPQRKILYYRNPMGLPDTSPIPKKDSMGMDYIGVYEGEGNTSNQVALSTEKIQKLGVKLEAVSMRELNRVVHAVGTIQINEQRLHTVSPRFEGWIERLHVNATGQPVARGQALMEVYSPELASAQAEYLIAVQAGMRQLAESSLTRLRNWGIDEAQLGELNKSGQARHTMTLSAPVAGIVLEKTAVQGMRFMPGEVLYKIADLSSVWVMSDIFEQDLALIKTGQTATVKVNAYPGQEFPAKISYIYPTLNSQTRTASVRLEINNPAGLLKPGMYAEVHFATGGKTRVLAVPSSAVIDSGNRRVALVEVAEGRFEPREVKLGQRAGDYVEVQSGLGEGEKVVTSANFLIDAESNLKAALAAFGASGSESKANSEISNPKPETRNPQREGR